MTRIRLAAAAIAAFALAAIAGNTAGPWGP